VFQSLLAGELHQSLIDSSPGKMNNTPWTGDMIRIFLKTIYVPVIWLLQEVDMALAKRTYTLSPQVVGDFEQVVPSGRRSALITELMRDWLDKRRREELRKEIVSGCQEMADEYLRIEEAYHPLEEEVERELNQAAPR
jgi:hypothetical protein